MTKTRNRPKVGFHIKYLIDILELCQEPISYTKLMTRALIRHKQTFNGIIKMCKDKGHLKTHKEPNPDAFPLEFVFYHITSQGRTLLKWLK